MKKEKKLRISFEKNWFLSYKSFSKSSIEDLSIFIPGSIVLAIRKRLSDLGMIDDHKEIKTSSNKQKRKVVLL